MKKTISVILSAAMLMSSLCINVSAAETEDDIYTAVDISNRSNSTVCLSESTAGTISDDNAIYPDFFIGQQSETTYKPYAISKESIDGLMSDGKLVYNDIPFAVDTSDNKKNAIGNCVAPVSVPVNYYSQVKVLTITPNEALGNNNIYNAAKKASDGKEISMTRAADVLVGQVDWAKVTENEDLSNSQKGQLVIETYNITDKTELINAVSLWLLPTASKRILAVTMVGLVGDDWSPLIAEKLAALSDSVADVNADDFAEIKGMIEKAEKSGADISKIEGIEKYNKLKTAFDNIYTTIDITKNYNSTVYLSESTAGTVSDDNAKYPDFFMGNSSQYSYTPYAISKEAMDELAPNGSLSGNGIPFYVNVLDNRKSACGSACGTISIPTGYYSAVKVLTVQSPNAGTASISRGVISASTGKEITGGASGGDSFAVSDVAWAKVKESDTLPTSAAKLTVETVKINDVAKNQLLNGVSLWLQPDSPKRILAVTMVGLAGDEWNPILAEKIAALPDNAADLNQDDLQYVTTWLAKAEKCGADISSIEGIEKYNKLMETTFNNYKTIDLSKSSNAVTVLSGATAGTITETAAPNFFIGSLSGTTYKPYAISKESLDGLMRDGKLTYSGIPFAVDTSDNKANAIGNGVAPFSVPEDYYSQVKVLTITPNEALGDNNIYRAAKNASDGSEIAMSRVNDVLAEQVDWANVTANDDLSNAKKGQLVIETYNITDKTKLINAVSLWLEASASKRILAVTMVELKGSEWSPVIAEKIAALPDDSKDVDADVFANLTKLIERAKDSGTDISSITGIDKYYSLKEKLEQFDIVDSCNAFYEDDYITINVGFKNAVDESSITKENIVVTCRRSAVDYSVSPITSGTGVTGARIILKNTLSSSDDYQLKVAIPNSRRYDRVFSIPKPITAENIVLKNSSGELIDRAADVTDGKIIFNADITNNTYSNGKAAKIITAIYNNGALYDSEITDVQLPYNEKYPFNVQMNVPVEGVDENWTTAVYVWDNDGITPLTAAKHKTYGIDAVNDSSKDLKVAFIGGSITEGGNYTTPFIEKWQADRTGKISVINAGIGGTDSSYGAIRLYEDVLKKKPDIVFVEFVLNDGWLSEAQIKKNVEGMIRQTYECEHQPVISFIYIPDRGKQADGSYVNIGYYDDVMNYYGLKGFNAHGLVTDAIKNGKYTWDDIVASNNVHPNKEQGENIAALMYDEFKNNNELYVKNIEWNQEKGFGVEDYGKPLNLASINAKYDSNWSDTKVDKVVSEGYSVPTSMPFNSFMATKTSGAYMTLDFRGPRLTVTALVSNQGRAAKYTITNSDGVIEKQGVINTSVSGSTWYEGEVLSIDGLENTEHTLKITVNDGTGLFGIGEFWIDE